MPRFQTVVRHARFVYSPYTSDEMLGFGQLLADTIRARIQSGRNIYDQAAAPLKPGRDRRGGYPDLKAARGLQPIRDWAWTRIDQYASDPHSGANFVFPAKKRQTDGHCSELGRKFYLSEPAAWSILRSSDFPGGGRQPPTWKVELVKGSPIAYLHTHFWDCENKLDAFPCGSV
jgi:hypothetical protein